MTKMTDPKYLGEKAKDKKNIYHIRDIYVLINYLTMYKDKNK